MNKKQRGFTEGDSIDTRKLVSIICPVHNEVDTLPIFYSRITKVIESVSSRYNFELIFINNRSEDATLDLLKEMQLGDQTIHIFTMSRNFGYQASLQAGMAVMSGDGMVIIDADCEDPPEMIVQFLEKWEEGYDVVYGKRAERHELWVIRKARNIFYHILRLSGDMDIVLYMAEFSLISAHVCEAIADNNNTFPFLRAEIGYAGFAKFGIPYKREKRVAGKTHYNFTSMVTFAIAGLLTSSTFLMRLAGYMFPLLVLTNVALLASWSFMGSEDALQICVVLNLTYIAYLLTIQGTYLARIYKNMLKRPVYIIDKKFTFTSKQWKDKPGKGM
ncbi:MAG: glycosyltransferase [Rhodospirillaceae bacterium]|jgi:dolichol-phosphate mannosyltransferase|nr:glycosyltransferase [Rhodospirillaceae bacterium]|tara:strand:+ start:231 stop:1223 length:993 start_codon:yes stop_codon:yes gene_type:complete